MGGSPVVGYVNVWPAIPIEVGANDTQAGSHRGADSRRGGDILKGAIAAVME